MSKKEQHLHRFPSISAIFIIGPIGYALGIIHTCISPWRETKKEAPNKNIVYLRICTETHVVLTVHDRECRRFTGQQHTSSRPHRLWGEPNLPNGCTALLP